MRIAVYHDLPSGGAKRALHRQIAGLVALGHEVEAFVPSTADEDFLPIAGLCTVHVEPREAPPDREKVLTGGAGVGERLRWMAYLRGIRSAERSLAVRIDARGFDVALVHPSQFTQAPSLLRHLRTPAVYYCHETLRAAHEKRVAPWPTRAALRVLLAPQDRANARSARILAVNSRYTASRVRALYGRRAVVNYLGVDTRAFRPLSAPRGDYVMTVAAMHPLKGIDFIVNAISRIDAHRRPPLVVVSDRSRTAERRRIDALAARAGVELRYHFRVREEELVALYCGARLVVYAPYDEPFGFVPLEAMACGKPVLGVAEGGIPETVVEGETGFLAPRDPQRFGARMLHLLEDPVADEVASRAVEHVRERWRWDRSVAQLAELCAQACGTARIAAQ